MHGYLSKVKKGQTSLKSSFDVLIVGGGPAGLSAALSLGRMSQTALICDDGRPRNEDSKHAHNLPFEDGINPVEWRAKTLENLNKYQTLSFYNGRVVSVEKFGTKFKAKLASGETPEFRKIILAYGLNDILPDAPGFKEIWAKTLFIAPIVTDMKFVDKNLDLLEVDYSWSTCCR